MPLGTKDAAPVVEVDGAVRVGVDGLGVLSHSFQVLA